MIKCLTNAAFMASLLMSMVTALRLAVPCQCSEVADLDTARGGSDGDCNAFVELGNCYFQYCDWVQCVPGNYTAYEDGTHWQGWVCNANGNQIDSQGQAYYSDCQEAGVYPKTKTGCEASSQNVNCGTQVACLYGSDPWPLDEEDAATYVSICDGPDENGDFWCQTANQMPQQYIEQELPPTSGTCNEIP